MLWRGFQVLLTVFNLAFAVLAMYFIMKGGVVTPESAGLDWKDFVTILLTALTVMVAIGALFIAVLAVWTYKDLRETVMRIAKETAESVATRTVREGRPAETDAADATAMVKAMDEEARASIADVDAIK